MVCLCEDLLSVGTYQMLWHQIRYTYMCLQHIQRVLSPYTMYCIFTVLCHAFFVAGLASHY